MDLDDPEYQSYAYLDLSGAWPYNLPEHLNDFGDAEGEQEDDKRTVGIMLWAGVVVVNPRRRQYEKTEAVDYDRRFRSGYYGYGQVSDGVVIPVTDDDIPF
jgi:hypothetical protein